MPQKARGHELDQLVCRVAAHAARGGSCRAKTDKPRARKNSVRHSGPVSRNTNAKPSARSAPGSASCARLRLCAGELGPFRMVGRWFAPARDSGSGYSSGPAGLEEAVRRWAFVCARKGCPWGRFAAFLLAASQSVCMRLSRGRGAALLRGRESEQNVGAMCMQRSGQLCCVLRAACCVPCFAASPSPSPSH